MAFCVQKCVKTLWDKVFTLQLSLKDSEQLRLFVRGSNSNYGGGEGGEGGGGGWGVLTDSSIKNLNTQLTTEYTTDSSIKNLNTQLINKLKNTLITV